MAGVDLVGLATFQPGDHAGELVTLDAVIENHGVGSALIAAVRQHAMAAGWKQVSVVTTNDNTRALCFYQKRGFAIAAVYVDAVADARKLKPGIPLFGADGIPIRDEIELHLMLV
jgi:GNAT superfamily N-acetyltransferase